MTPKNESSAVKTVHIEKKAIKTVKKCIYDKSLEELTHEEVMVLVHSTVKVSKVINDHIWRECKVDGKTLSCIKSDHLEKYVKKDN